MQRSEIIRDSDVFAALERIHREKFGRGGTASQYEEDVVPALMRRTIACYEAGKALIGCLIPYYDELAKVRTKNPCEIPVNSLVACFPAIRLRTIACLEVTKCGGSTVEGALWRLKA